MLGHVTNAEINRFAGAADGQRPPVKLNGFIRAVIRPGHDADGFAAACAD